MSKRSSTTKINNIETNSKISKISSVSSKNKIISNQPCILQPNGQLPGYLRCLPKQYSTYPRILSTFKNQLKMDISKPFSNLSIFGIPDQADRKFVYENVLKSNPSISIVHDIFRIKAKTTNLYGSEGFWVARVSWDRIDYLANELDGKEISFVINSEQILPETISETDSGTVCNDDNQNQHEINLKITCRIHVEYSKPKNFTLYREKMKSQNSQKLVKLILFDLSPEITEYTLQKKLLIFSEVFEIEIDHVNSRDNKKQRNVYFYVLAPAVAKILAYFAVVPFFGQFIGSKLVVARRQRDFPGGFNLRIHSNIEEEEKEGKEKRLESKNNIIYSTKNQRIPEKKTLNSESTQSNSNHPEENENIKTEFDTLPNELLKSLTEISSIENLQKIISENTKNCENTRKLCQILEKQILLKQKLDQAILDGFELKLVNQKSIVHSTSFSRLN